MPKIRDRTLIMGHYSEIYGPVQALSDYCKRRVYVYSSVLHPLPDSTKKYSYYETARNGQDSEIARIFRRGGFESLSYLQDLILTFRLVMGRKRRYSVCIGIDSLNAFAGILLRMTGFVEKVVFYVIDYTPRRFNNSVVNAVYHILDRFCVAHSDFVWNISIRIQAVRYKQGLRSTKNLLVPVGIERNTRRATRGYETDHQSLIYAGHLAKSKGIDLIIEAMTEIAKKFPNASLQIVGSGSDETRLKQMVEELGLGDRVHFKGAMDHDALMEYLPSRGVGIATYVDDPSSITYFADPTKPKEYLASGLPVVITKVPWIAALIQSEQMGLAIDYSKNQLVDAVSTLLSDARFYENCRRNALNYASALDWDTIFDEAIRESQVQ